MSKILSINEFEKLPDYEYYIKHSDCIELGITNLPDEPDVVVDRDPYPSLFDRMGKFGGFVREGRFDLYNIKGKAPIYKEGVSWLISKGFWPEDRFYKDYNTEDRCVGLYMDPERRRDVGLIFKKLYYVEGCPEFEALRLRYTFNARE